DLPPRVRPRRTPAAGARRCAGCWRERMAQCWLRNRIRQLTVPISSKALPPVGLGVGWSASNSISAGPAHHLPCPPPSRSPSIRRYYIEYRITRESLPPDDLVTLKKSGDFDECRLRTNLWHRGPNLQH